MNAHRRKIVVGVGDRGAVLALDWVLTEPSR
ncbi:MAG: hypothetical protein QOE23_3372 [Pseudonocardiales bacterium]|jgi:hypothetical protein|nr:hypothetical protein [Pseudonocardiales bacterium]